MPPSPQTEPDPCHLLCKPDPNPCLHPSLRQSPLPEPLQSLSRATPAEAEVRAKASWRMTRSGHGEPTGYHDRAFQQSRLIEGPKDISS
uniref:Uncharacterized protein n=1 Tax=Cucumis melo TaxID=3656 RepID=A0A9I9E9S4_CUCME